MATTFVDYEGVVCADWLNQVSRTVEDALGSANTPQQALTNLGAVGDAPSDSSIYGRQNGSWVVVSIGGSPTSDYIIKTPVAQENIINPGGTGTAYPLIINAHASQDAAVPLLLVRDSSEDPTFEVFESTVKVTEKAAESNGVDLFLVEKSDGSPIFRVDSGNATDDNIVWVGGDPQVDGAIKLVGTGVVRAGITRYTDAPAPLLRLEADVAGTTNQTYANRALLFNAHKIDSTDDPEPATTIDLLMDENRNPTGTQRMIAQLRASEGTNAMYGELVLASYPRSNANGITAEVQTWQLVCSSVLAGSAGKMGWYYDNSAPNGARKNSAAPVLDMLSTGALTAQGWQITAGGSLSPISDARLKDNIVDADSKLAGICALKVREFDFEPTGTRETGFVAQEVGEVFPELMIARDDGYFGYNESVLNRYLVKAVQELAAQVEELRHAA